jgi:hypothetical protein
MPAERRVLPGAVTAEGLRLRIEGLAWEAPRLRLVPEVAAARSHPRPVTHGARDGPWVLDLTGLAPDQVYELDLDPPNAVHRAVVRTPPARIDDGHALTLALLSCYFPAEEFVRYPDRALDCLVLRDRSGRRVPHLKILCGDQIYADVPAAPVSGAKELYASRYADAWRPGRLGRLLAYGANVFACDDHEYWNSYPDWSVYLGRTYDRSWAEWAREGRDALWRHQGIWNFAPGVVGGAGAERAWCRWRAAGVDFFVADTRTDRTSPSGERNPASPGSGPVPPVWMSAAQRSALLDWIATVRRLGVLVVGQPLLARPGSLTDSALPDYVLDYGMILRALGDAIADRGVSILVLSGDIHWGRLVHWSPRGRGGRLVEFVSSPIARVSLQSILGRWLPTVGARADTTLDLAAHVEFREHVPGFVATREFASNENNVGVVEIGGAGRDLHATFELWSLEQRAPARNHWSGSGGACVATVPL